MPVHMLAFCFVFFFSDCFMKQEEWLFALADYQQAEELDPQNRNVWPRLAIIHNTLGLQSFSNL